MQCNWWCVACGGQSSWKAPNRALVIQDSTDRREAQVLRAHAAPQGVCATNWSMRSSSWPTSINMATSPVKMVVQNLQERSRHRIMDGPRKSIMVENHEAVKVGEQDQNVESRKVVKPKFTRDFPEAIVREGLTLRTEQEGMLRTFICRWRLPLVDECWHAICQAIFQGVEGSEWETMYYKYKELHQAVQCETSGENKKAKALWSLKETKDKRTDFYDLDSVQKIQTGSQVRLDLWAIQLKSPTAAVASAPKRTEQKCGSARSSATSDE